MFSSVKALLVRCLKRDLYSRLAPHREPPLIACAPSQTDEAFILDAFTVGIYFETTGGDEEEFSSKSESL